MHRMWRILAIAGGATLGGAAALVGVPLVVSALGFKALGIGSGSAAASIMSAWAPTTAGGVVATLQSVGAAGMGAAGTAATAAAGAVTGAAVTGAAYVVKNKGK